MSINLLLKYEMAVRSVGIQCMGGANDALQKRSYLLDINKNFWQKNSELHSNFAVTNEIFPAGALSR